MDIPEHDPRSRCVAGTWVVEPQNDALTRTPAFGQRFFRAAFSEFAAVAAGVRFLRWSLQPEHVYAVFDLHRGGAGVQIDPDLEYIIVWGAGGQGEYGDWDGDQVPPAMDYLRRLIEGGSDSPELKERLS
ncbi:hypothetical protein [Gemmata obscuriglobus]|uniref:hypothetical protein n=1 Tax=Gemmata obscuriglobus TaxID=114 RepID=UPI0011CE4369|nr:hypothetical protein [Gemmata obscuriglobus]